MIIFLFTKKGFNIVKRGFRTLNKNIINQNNFWSIKSSHDGYVKTYGVLHERTLEYHLESNRIVGKDNLIKKNNFLTSSFEIRFHLMPNTKVTKTQDNKAILIELENSGWRFYSNDGTIDVESGLYFGKKNEYIENKNICLSGLTKNEEQIIEWEIKKI